MTALTHIGADGRARMVDVGEKPASERRAVAEGLVRMRRETLELAMQGRARKGDVFAIAEISGIMGAKQTSQLIPLCHPLQLSAIAVEVQRDESSVGLRVTATVATIGPTGVEMEALTAVSVACLTLYDMLKAVDREMTIEGVRLVEKTGGESGLWRRAPA